MKAHALSRLDLVAESFRAVLNELTVADTKCLRSVAQPEWFERYVKRIEDHRFPKGRDARHKLILKVAEDDYLLLNALEVKAGLEAEVSLKCPPRKKGSSPTASPMWRVAVPHGLEP